jgi:hypothetical protein
MGGVSHRRYLSWATSDMSDVEMAARSTPRACEVDPRRSPDGAMPGVDNVLCGAEHLRFPLAFHVPWCGNLFNDRAVFRLTRCS